MCPGKVLPSTDRMTCLALTVKMFLRLQDAIASSGLALSLVVMQMCDHPYALFTDRSASVPFTVWAFLRINEKFAPPPHQRSQLSHLGVCSRQLQLRPFTVGLESSTPTFPNLHRLKDKLALPVQSSFKFEGVFPPTPHKFRLLECLSGMFASSCPDLFAIVGVVLHLQL